MLDYESDHYCPAYKKVISIDLCYDSLCCLTGMFKISSTKELAEIENIEEARKPLFTTKGNLERSGMGFTIMDNFMDSLKVESIVGIGTKVTMNKKIKKTKEEITY